MIVKKMISTQKLKLKYLEFLLFFSSINKIKITIPSKIPINCKIVILSLNKIYPIISKKVVVQILKLIKNVDDEIYSKYKNVNLFPIPKRRECQLNIILN